MSFFFKKTRFWFFFFREIFKRQFKNILLGLIIGILLFYSLYKFLPLLKLKKTEKIGILGQYQINEVPQEILNQISFGLTEISENGEPRPKLAEKWTVSEYQKTYTFIIPSDLNIKWHDQTTFRPSDVNYKFQDVDFKIEGNSLIFTLKEPFSPFPSIVAKPIFKKGLIGLGDYKVKKISQKGKYLNFIHLTPFENKNLPEKIYKFYLSEKDLKTGFNLGEIDIVDNLLNLDQLYLGKNVQVSQKIITNAYIGLFYNTSKPPFSSKFFRQALAYSITKDNSNRVLTPINPLSWAYNPDVKPYIQDLNRAKELLKSENTDPSTLKITISTFPQFEKIASQIKDDWQKIGINSEIKIVTFIPDDFDVIILAREIPADPDQYYFWHSTQPGNISKIKSPRLDKLLEDGRTTIDKKARKEIYFDFQRFLAEELPVVFLYHPVVYSIRRI